MATRLRRRRRQAARQGPTPSIGRPAVAATPGTAGLGSNANSLDGFGAKGVRPPLLQAEASPVVGRHRPVVALAVLEVHPIREEGALLSGGVHAPVGLLLGITVQGGPLLLCPRIEGLDSDRVDAPGEAHVGGVVGEVVVVR